MKNADKANHSNNGNKQVGLKKDLSVRIQGQDNTKQSDLEISNQEPSRKR